MPAKPGVLKLHWKIAPDYYLYRGRMKFTGGDGVTLGTAELPDGEKHHDEYLGDVETYHHGVDARMPYTLAPGTSAADAWRCSTRAATRSTRRSAIRRIPSSSTWRCRPAPRRRASAGTGNPLRRRAQRARQRHRRPRHGWRARCRPSRRSASRRWPPRPTGCCCAGRMPKGYYLYRDQTTLTVAGAPGLSLTPAWPAGTAHHDEHYGDVTVYFDQVELPVGINGDLGGRHQLTLQASFQGCQQGGICYPVMTRTVTVDLGGGAAAAAAHASAPQPPDDARRRRCTPACCWRCCWRWAAA